MKSMKLSHTTTLSVGGHQFDISMHVILIFGHDCNRFIYLPNRYIFIRLIFCVYVYGRVDSFQYSCSELSGMTRRHPVGIRQGLEQGVFNGLKFRI